MTKKEFVDEFNAKVKEAGIKVTKKDLSELVNLYGQVILENIGKDNLGIRVADGIVLKRRLMPAREFRNPATGESIIKEDRYAPRATFNRAVKDLVASYPVE